MNEWMNSYYQHGISVLVYASLLIYFSLYKKNFEHYGKEFLSCKHVEKWNLIFL